MKTNNSLTTAPIPGLCDLLDGGNAISWIDSRTDYLPILFWPSHDQNKYFYGWPLRVMLTGVSCSADLDWLGCLDDVSWQIVPCWDYRSNLWDRFTSNLKSLHVFRNQSHDVLWGLLKNEFLHILCWSFKLKECHSQSRVTLCMTNGNCVPV